MALHPDNIQPFNDKLQRHGYWIAYNTHNDLLSYEGLFLNGDYRGLWLWYDDDDGSLYIKEYYI